MCFWPRCTHLFVSYVFSHATSFLSLCNVCASSFEHLPPALFSLAEYVNSQSQMSIRKIRMRLPLKIWKNPSFSTKLLNGPQSMFQVESPIWRKHNQLCMSFWNVKISHIENSNNWSYQIWTPIWKISPFRKNEHKL